MIPGHHIGGETLMSYAAGTLDAAVSAVVACHLDWCPHCRARLRRLETLGSVLLESIEPAPISPGGVERALEKARLIAGQRASNLQDPYNGLPQEQHLPRPLARRTGLRRATIPWKWLAPGVKHYRVPLPAGAIGDLRIFHLKPGYRMPEHGHKGRELTLILWGAYSDNLGRFRTGDVADLDDATEHQPVADSHEGCICLSARENPARFKGAVARILQPLIGV